MKKNIIVLLLINTLLVTTSFSAKATNAQNTLLILDAEKESREESIYNVTYSMCSNYSTDTVLNMAWNGIKDTIEITGKMNVEAALLLIENRGISSHLAILLNSDSYYKALQNCFGEAASREAAQFTFSLILADTSGELLGVAISIVSVKKIFQVLSYFIKIISMKYPLAGYFIVKATMISLFYEFLKHISNNQQKNMEEKKLKRTSLKVDIELVEVKKDFIETRSLLVSTLSSVHDITDQQKTALQEQIQQIDMQLGSK